MDNQPKITILMTSYNNGRFIGEQIDSILAQTWSNWDLIISDDASSDNSWDILKRYEDDHPDRIQVVRGPHRGGFANNMSLLTDYKLSSDYFACCDSDDVWLPEKLQYAMEKLMPLGHDGTVAYASRVAMVNAENRTFGLSPLCTRVQPCFGNALAQSSIGGATLVFNESARELIALGSGCDLFAYDWWSYLILSGAGAHIVYDPRPTMRYRIHDTNQVGKMPGFMTTMRHFVDNIKGYKCNRDVKPYLLAINKFKDRLTPDNRRRLSAMLELHDSGVGLYRRIKLVRQACLCRQSKLETIALYFLALLGRL